MRRIEVDNLNISTYTFKEILDLFDLGHLEKIGFNITLSDLKNTKKKVLMLHPDKSNLSPEYFLFYKKAYEVLLKHYEENNKQNKDITNVNTDYKIELSAHSADSSTVNSVSKVLSTENKEFNKKFNSLFEKNVKKPPNLKNKWFSNEEEDTACGITTTVPINKSNINAVFEKIRQEKQKNELVAYKEFGAISSTGSIKLANLYDDEDTSDDTTSSQKDYVSSNPFDKLKYDDLRKVHKDQTIFSVGESDLNKIKTFDSLEELKQHRIAAASFSPSDEKQAELLLQSQRDEYNKKIALKRFASQKKTDEYESMNRSVLSSFLRIM